MCRRPTHRDILVIELEDVFRMEWGRILSAVMPVLGDFDLAEEALQEAFSCAVAEWATETPRNPRAWLYTTARHKAIDTIRRRANFAEIFFFKQKTAYEITV